MEKSKHRELSLRPYPGKILHCHTLEELRAQYESKTGQSCPYKDDPNGGRFVKIELPDEPDIWLVFAATPHALAHEFCHVLLHVFEMIGCEPKDGNGEPFCYMLSQLLLDATEK